MKIFDFKEYQSKALETAKYPVIARSYIYPLLGLTGEYFEFLKAIDEAEQPFYENEEEYKKRGELIKKEAGDVLWYIAVLAHEMDFRLEYINISKMFLTQEERDLGDKIGQLNELVKKTFRDNAGKLELPKAHLIMAQIVNAFIGTVEICDLDIDEIAEINIAKIKDRKERGVLSGSGDNR